MTLSKLAALAAEKVPGFKRPMSSCRTCACWTRVRVRECPTCHGGDWALDSSPAALLMAVVTIPRHTVEKHWEQVRVCADTDGFSRSCGHDGEPESIARAALVALLRAHGVEVSDG